MTVTSSRPIDSATRARLQNAKTGRGAIICHVRSAIAVVRIPSTEPGPSQKTNARIALISTPSFSTQRNTPVPASSSAVSHFAPAGSPPANHPTCTRADAASSISIGVFGARTWRRLGIARLRNAPAVRRASEQNPALTGVGRAVACTILNPNHSALLP